jgi:hypothetical protein
MNHDLALSLDLAEQGSWGFRFRLAATNRSAVRLLVPSPDVTDLRFRAEVAAKEAEWYTGLLVSAAGGAFTLEPSEAREFEWRVRPCDVERPESYDDYDYYRWCVDLPPGAYSAWFRWRVDAEYFAPDSHVRFSDLEYWAEKDAAVVWQGTAESNRVTVVRGSGE